MKNYRILLKQLEKKKRNLSKEQKTQVIGALIKKRRKELNLTQENLSRGLCSNSYLSKIESNKIVPNEESLMLLMERVSISNVEIMCYGNSSELFEKAISAFYFLNEKEYQELFDLVQDSKENIIAETIKLGYYLLKNDIVNAKKSFGFNVDYSSTMDDVHTIVYSVFTAYYFVQTKAYKEALELVPILETYDFTDVKIKYLIKYVSFKLYFEVGRPVKAESVYQELLEMTLNDLNLKRMIKLKLIHVDMCLSEGEYKQAKSELQTINQVYFDVQDSEFYLYLEIRVLFHNKDLVELFNTFERLGEEFAYYEQACYFVYSVLQEEKKDSFIGMIKEINGRKESVYYKYLIHAHERKLTRDFFSREVLTDIKINENVYVRRHWTFEFVKLLTELSRYKDALSYEQLTIDLFNKYKD